ncbi:MAG: hypothetical protein CVU79_13035 [Elusimicrobia bacterium HGW-Elusimicrobia-3]|nr:MAG: hypothetical protein CVU79_13035 [Elusimicrobia bacterium HGW-Elusimicrobia-3]
MKPGWKKGIVLVQTLVISVILSMIAVMVMKWVLARYMLAARNYRSSEAASHSQWVAADRLSQWNFYAYPDLSNVPSTGVTTLDGTNVRYSRTGGMSMRVTITADQE